MGCARNSVGRWKPQVGASALSSGGSGKRFWTEQTKDLRQRLSVMGPGGKAVQGRKGCPRKAWIPLPRTLDFPALADSPGIVASAAEGLQAGALRAQLSGH